MTDSSEIMKRAFVQFDVRLKKQLEALNTTLADIEPPPKPKSGGRKRKLTVRMPLQ